MQCVSVSYGKVSGKARRYPYFQPALYESATRKRDGAQVWRYLRHLGTARRSYRLACEDAKALAESHGCELIGNVRHGSVILKVAISGEHQ